MLTSRLRNIKIYPLVVRSIFAKLNACNPLNATKYLKEWEAMALITINIASGWDRIDRYILAYTTSK